MHSKCIPIKISWTQWFKIQNVVTCTHDKETIWYIIIFFFHYFQLKMAQGMSEWEMGVK